MDFQKGNELYRRGEYEQAASYYVKALKHQSEFKPCYVNLALAIRKIENKAICEKLLKNALSTLRPGKTDDVLSTVKKSKLVNDKWYVVEHAEWLPKKVDPILHYLVVGWRLGLSPCQRFDNNFYLENHKSQLEPGEAPLLHYLYKGKKQGNEIKNKETSGADDLVIQISNSRSSEVNRKRLRLSDLAVQLWNGHSAYALKELEAIYSNEHSTEASRWWAMWHTARWLYFCGEIENTLAFAEKMQQLKGVNDSRKEAIYLKFFCLLALDRADEAYTELSAFVRQHPKDADVHFTLSNAISDDNMRIELINKAFAIHGFSGVYRKDESKPFGIGNVGGLPAPKVGGVKKVSIIMPIYSAGEKVRIAIESLLAQTYENIEIIAVDDCSPDDTFKVLKTLEKQDSRVKAVQPSQNGGAYAARNYGLTFATGDLLTTHDSDDWSHPQKIATQVAYLEANPAIKGCSVYWIRARENLTFTQNWRPNDFLIHWSQSSFMFHREVLETIGEWDHVRIGGDTEYIWRMQAQFGKKSFAKIFDDTPLAFALDEESSLTRTKATHVRTVYFGLRHIYREICAWWHTSQKHLHVKDAKTKRIFPAPRSMFERGNDPLEFDTVIAGDYSRLEDCESVASYIREYPKKKIALFHWPSVHKKPEALCNLYFEMLQEGKVEPVVMGQTVQARNFSVTDEELVEYPLDGLPDWIGFKEWKILF